MLPVFLSRGRSREWIRLGIRDYDPIRLHVLSETITAVLLNRALRPGDVALDVGANRGVHSRHMLGAVGARGHVHAVEPNPVLAARLERWNEPRLLVHRVAAGAEGGTATLHVPEDDDAWGSLLDAHLAGRTLRNYPVETTKIDQLLCAEDQPRLVKLDVERYEDRALAGMSDLLHHARPLVIFEAPEDDTSVQRLRSAGYEVMDLLGRPLNENDHRFVNLLAVPREHATAWRLWAGQREIREINARIAHARWKSVAARAARRARWRRA